MLQAQGSASMQRPRIPCTNMFRICGCGCVTHTSVCVFLCDKESVVHKCECSSAVQQCSAAVRPLATFFAQSKQGFVRACVRAHVCMRVCTCVSVRSCVRASLAQSLCVARKHTDALTHTKRVDSRSAATYQSSRHNPMSPSSHQPPLSRSSHALE